MTLAIFDLDNTLLGGDSDYLWGQFLVEQGLVDGEAYERENQRFVKLTSARTSVSMTTMRRVRWISMNIRRLCCGR